MSDYSHSSKKKKAKKGKVKNNEISDNPPDTESSDEELDLTKECHPIAHYMNDRAEMISQMFSVIKGNKLRSMLPPILKDYDIEKLKLQCLDQLLGMSEKRINCILDGEVLETSSESDDTSDVESDDSGDSSESEKNEKASKHSNNNKRKVKRKSDTESVGKASKISKTENDSQPVEKGKTLLEILELEMRARAIRALLKQGAETEESTPVTQEETLNSGVVDLTVDEEEFPTVIKTEPESTEQEKSFDSKVVKSVEADKPKEEAKKKRLMAEIELRNKLIKKKSYRTQQQRIDNLGEETIDQQKEINTEKESQTVILPEIKIKEEPKEIVIEDPEEGEVSSDEEVAAVVVKEEKEATPEPCPEVEKQVDGERILAIDNGLFIANANLSLEQEALDAMEIETGTDVIELLDDEEEELLQNTDSIAEESNENSQESQESMIKNSETQQEESGLPEEGATWRERWLSKDEVQKVVKSSKICGLVKKRIASKKLKKVEEEKIAAEVEPAVLVTPTVAVEGSVREYKKLMGKVSDGDGANDVMNESEESSAVILESSAIGSKETAIDKNSWEAPDDNSEQCTSIGAVDRTEAESTAKSANNVEAE